MEVDAGWPRKDDINSGLERPDGGCRSGSALERRVRPAGAEARAGRPRKCYGTTHLADSARRATSATCDDAAMLRGEAGATDRQRRVRSGAQPNRRSRAERCRQAETSRRGVSTGSRLCCQAGLTFELTPTAEAGGVSRDCDDSTTGAGPAYDACRSGSGVERGVRRHPRAGATTLAGGAHRACCHRDRGHRPSALIPTRFRAGREAAQSKFHRLPPLHRGTV